MFARGFVDAVAEVAVVLDERARRLLLGAAARQIGRGGITLVAAASADTVGRGAAELEAGVVADGRVRAKGAGRHLVEQTDPQVWPELEKLVDPETRGDPMSELRWTTKSTVKLADELTAQDHRVASNTVARLLKDHGYSLRENTKTVEGRQHPDRDAQFRYLNSQVAQFLAAGVRARGRMTSTRRPPRVTEPFSVPWRTAVRSGLCLPFRPAAAVTSASNIVCITAIPAATLIASSPSLATAAMSASARLISSGRSASCTACS